jgi:GntR family transcriptional regulator/MocR family aminotransferase
MQKTRATSAGLDLHLELSGTRPRAGLEAALREAVRGGRLAPGTALPSSRALARDLGVARNTVAEAYGQLAAEGWLAARHGSGTWVAQRVRPQPAAPVPGRAAAARSRYDLQPGTPDLTAFPRTAWLTAARRALASAPARDLGYTDPRGIEGLRVALAGYLARARGVAVTPDRIVVCAGFSQGLELVCAALQRRGVRTMAVESYGHAGHREIAAGTGLELFPLPVDDHGADVSALAAPPEPDRPRARDQRRQPASPRSPAWPGAVLLTPSHQFPLGVALEPRRRRAVAEWASATGAIVIEDDYDGEFRYDRQAVGALQSLAPDHVVFAGTASKSLAPGLRLGWLALPPGLAGEVIEIKRATARLSSSLDQLTLAEFITSGGYDRQVRRARNSCRQRRDRLVGALRQQVPGVRVTGISAGLHVLVQLPSGVTEEDVVSRAAQRGLALQGMAVCRAGSQELPPAVIVGYATPPGHAFSTAVARLCAVLADAIGAGQRS